MTRVFERPAPTREPELPPRWSVEFSASPGCRWHPVRSFETREEAEAFVAERRREGVTGGLRVRPYRNPLTMRR